jgi:hypothetical protein
MMFHLVMEFAEILPDQYFSMVAEENPLSIKLSAGIPRPYY